MKSPEDVAARLKGTRCRFGAFVLDAPKRSLLKDGRPVPLTPRVYDTLVALVSGQGTVLSKEELLRAVWGDGFVEENSLSQSVSALRRALGDDANGSRYIATVPRKGYSFVASVTELESVGANVPAPIAQTKPFRRPGVRLAASALAVLAIVLGLIRMGRRSPASETGARIRSIAVLPFKDLAPAPGGEYLGVALEESLITRLGRIENLSVPAASVVGSLGSHVQDPVSAGRVLGVEGVLD